LLSTAQKMATPVLVLNANTKREVGRKAQLGNIMAAKSVADIIRTTLGPRSMLKMILDPMGGTMMTNDGNAILREIDVSHPAAKSMIELSRTQDEEVGDGTTSVIILAGEFLSAAQPFLQRNVHPRVIVGAYVRALDDALEALTKLSISLNPKDRQQILTVVRSCIGTKFVSRFGDLVAQIAVDAVTKITVDLENKNKEIDFKRYARIEKVPGGYAEDSRVLNGVMLNKDVVHQQMKRRIENPRILLLDCTLEYKKGESVTQLDLSHDDDFETVLKIEEEAVEAMCKDIIKFRPTLVFTEKGVSDLAAHYLVKAGISVIRRVRKTDNNRIARATGATICHDPSDILEKDIGTGCGLFEIKQIGDEYFTYLVECKDPKACTILLRGASKEVLNEIERNLLDAMNVVRNIVFDPRVVLGGGATEMAIGKILLEKSKSINGPMQWPYRAIASALEVIPRTLVENCGASTIRLMTRLRAEHAEGKTNAIGIDGKKGDLANMNELKIFDPVLVKSQTYKTAIEAACMLLRIDEIASGMSKSGGGGGGGAPAKPPAAAADDDTFGDSEE